MYENNTGKSPSNKAEIEACGNMFVCHWNKFTGGSANPYMDKQPPGAPCMASTDAIHA